MGFIRILHFAKRPFLARRSGFGAYRLPVPRQEFVEAAAGMTVGHALQTDGSPARRAKKTFYFHCCLARARCLFD
jgi:hypothetical protein